MPRRRPWALGVPFVALACGPHPGTSSAASAPAPVSRAPTVRPAGGAPVVIAVVIDQLAAWVAAERWPRLPESGGFARLRREGTWVTDLTYLHAGTETAMGHSALFSGSIPRETGIVGNAVWRADLDPPREGSLLEDRGYRVVGPAGVVTSTADGRRAKNGISLAQMTSDRMWQPLLADRLVARDPRAVVVALSLKDRGAVFGGGHRPTALLWFDDDAGTLVTSMPQAEAAAAQGDPLPAWARPLERPSEADHGVWTLFDSAFIARNAGDIPDDQPGEMPDVGGRIFPHVIAGPGFPKRFRATPTADALLADLGIAAIEHARDPGHPMLLTISFSANDYIGHTFGPDSWEAWDELEELDATLGRFFDRLDARLGPAGYAVVLSGDHGIVPFPLPAHPAWCAAGAPNPYEKPCGPAVRLSADAIKSYLEGRLAARLGHGDIIRAVVDTLVYLTPEALALPPDRRRALDDAIREELMTMTLDGEHPIADVRRTAEFAGACPPPADETIPALVCRTTTTSRGDLYVVPRAGAFYWGKPGAHDGASHGTAYRYDRTVPLLVRYPSGLGGQVVARAAFGSYYASAWFALTGEALEGPYGGVVGEGGGRVGGAGSGP